MKLKLKNITIVVLLLSSTVSCNLDTSSTNALDDRGAFKNTKNAESVLRGAWEHIFSYGFSEANTGIGSSMLSDDFAGSDVVRAINSYGFLPSYSLISGYGYDQINNDLWSLMYGPINNCNNIIKRIDTVLGTTQEKEQIKGQAFATRGFLYLYLASHYSFAIDKDPNAVCVPIYTEPTDRNIAFSGNPASSVSEVYQQALEDLTKALSLIPQTYSHGLIQADQYLPDYLVTLGLLARANLYSCNWQQAYDYAVEVLAINNYLMNEEEYKSGFNNYSNKEWIWGYSSIPEDRKASSLFNFKDCTTPGSSYTNFNADPWFKELFEDGDYRKDLFNWGLTNSLDWAMLNSKFKFKDINNGLADIVLMRTSEMYLIKAEAASHLLGKELEAQQTLQILRDKRMKSGTAFKIEETGTALINEIWKERRKELWGEGFSLTDIIRNQQSLDRRSYEAVITIDGEQIEVKGHNVLHFPDNSSFVPNSRYTLFRIPETEERKNKNLYSKYSRLPIYN